MHRRDARRRHLQRARERLKKRAIFGAVTTGSLWTFLALHETNVVIDLDEYYLREIERVVGVLVHMVTWTEA